MSNAFHWQGQPSIFTTNGPPRAFGMGREQNRLRTSLRQKHIPVTLPGSSMYAAPKLLATKRKPSIMSSS